MTGGISPQKALVISLPLDGGSCSGLHTRIYIYIHTQGGRQTDARLDVECSRFIIKAREHLSVVTLNLGGNSWDTLVNRVF